ncbi:hypothetical protein [Shewanella sp. OMA3-2]|uniref:hypothetical protein n=1 Tax=Shewanella sp. OMA3-2 TaxID=2908650 RepID=UPI001F410D64|nr:hypothetical protein [Shewanella sp. OMA3-2]UJF22349.1 hypothetical protein L0B17_02640 [Shewanella sp. OMA3-2]
MALSRKKWNTIIILVTAIMITVLSFINSKTEQVPVDAMPLFDSSLPLKQLHINKQWLADSQGQWQCSDGVLNCQKWAAAWQNIAITALQVDPIHTSKPIKVAFAIANIDEPLVWQLFTEEGLLLSPGGNWYKIPPSLRADLLPIIKVKSR